jgi:hypothetical protein
MLCDNPVAKAQHSLDAMKDSGSPPEFECFDTTIGRE